MLNPASLGQENLTELVSLLRAEEDSIIGRWMLPQVVSRLPAGSVSELEGLAPYVPGAQLMGSTKQLKEIGYSADVPSSELKISNRKYRIRRMAEKIPHNKKFSKSRLFSQLKEEIVPALTRKIQFTADVLHLADILKGNGTADESRNVTTIDLTGEEWDTANADILARLTDAVKRTGADIIVLGDDVMEAIQRSDEVTSASAGSGTVILTRQQAAAFLSGYLGVPNIVIGTHGYQNGAPSFALNLDYAFNGVAYVGKKANLAWIPWDVDGIEFFEYEKDENRTVYTQAELWGDLITYDPDYSIAFTNVLAG